MDFHKIKNIFKQNADLICNVNVIFDVIVSDIILILLFSCVKDFLQMLFFFTSVGSLSKQTVLTPDQQYLLMANKIWIFLDFCVILSKLVAIVITIKLVAKINKQIKLILINLQDLASEYIQKPSDIFQSASCLLIFRLV